MQGACIQGASHLLGHPAGTLYKFCVVLAQEASIQCPWAACGSQPEAAAGHPEAQDGLTTIRYPLPALEYSQCAVRVKHTHAHAPVAEAAQVVLSYTPPERAYQRCCRQAGRRHPLTYDARWWS